MTTITAPLATITLQGLAPDVVRSCIVQQPSPPPDPGETPPPPVTAEGIYTPVAPGVTYEALPTVSIVDTSPDQMIGCIIDTADNPQGRLNALFPSAVDGDGVIERSTNDIWVFDGTTWNNVGPTPGPTIVTATVVPPWNEIVVYDARVRSRLEVTSLAYGLSPLTEPDPYGISLGLVPSIVNKFSVPAADLALAAHAPSVGITTSFIDLMAAPLAYAGNGTTQAIEPGFPAGMVWLRAGDRVFGNDNNFVYDIVQGPGNYWDVSTSDEQSTDANSVTGFTQTGFTIGSSNDTNSSSDTYIGHAFPRLAAPITNTAGTITTSVAVGQCYSIATYSGNGTSGATVGHGLPTTPQFIFAKQLVGGNSDAVAGGPVIGDDYQMALYGGSTRSSNTSVIKSATSTTITIGNSVRVNTSGSTYAIYSFAEVPGVSKISTYTGDNDAAGQFIDCGFEVGFLLLKYRNGGTMGQSPWFIFDRADNGGFRVYELSEYEPYQDSDQICVLESTGFRAYRGRGAGTFSDINQTSATYLFMAFARGIPTVEIPAGAIDVAALAPSVT